MIWTIVLTIIGTIVFLAAGIGLICWLEDRANVKRVKKHQAEMVYLRLDRLENLYNNGGCWYNIEGEK